MPLNPNPVVWRLNYNTSKFEKHNEIFDFIKQNFDQDEREVRSYIDGDNCMIKVQFYNQESYNLMMLLYPTEVVRFKDVGYF